MTAFRTILVILPLAVAFEQSELVGSWTSHSVILDGKTKELKKWEKYSRVEFDFSEDKTYTKTFYSPRINDEILYYKYFEVKDEELVHKPVRTQDGYPLKMMVMDKKIETGTFAIDLVSGILTLNPDKKDSYQYQIELTDSELTLTDSIDGLEIFIRLSVDEGRKKKRGSS